MELQPNSNRERLVDIFLDKIMHGQLLKGEKLPTERQLSEELNVSRASVREALKALDAMGITYSIQGSGTYITDSPETSINRTLCALFALSGGTLGNVLQLRMLLESEACRMIIEEASDEEIAQIVKLSQYDYEAPVKEHALYDAAFHRGLVSMSKSPLISYLYTTLSSLMDIYRERVLIATRDANEDNLTKLGHAAICNALVRRDYNAATTAVKEHLALSEAYKESLLHI